jgi:aminomethyltransferase
MSELKKTPLHDRHVALGGKMVDFGGWHMPVQFAGLGVEHEAVRTKAGLFDVSHMGEAYVSGPKALEWLQRMTTNDVSKLTPGRIHYSGLLYPNGGFVDDLLVYCEASDRYLLVINAGNTAKDVTWLASNLPATGVLLENKSSDTAQIAIQGPLSEKIFQPLTQVPLAPMKYYRFARGKVCGHEAIVSRTGYTGEDGFEIYCAPEDAGEIWDALLAAGEGDGIAPCGLGARDTLRLEAKMALYGNDIDATTTPLEADLGWIVAMGKGDFVGRHTLERQQGEGLTRKLVGFEMVERGIARHGYPVSVEGREVGVVTSGTQTPTLGKAIGLAYLPIDRTAIGAEFDVLIRGKATRARVVPTPFYSRKKK